MSNRSVHLHRVLKTSPEKVYRAFLEGSALAKWLPPYGFTCTVHHLEPQVGGTFRMSFHNFGSGDSHSFGGEYLELVANERIRSTDTFEDPHLHGVLEVTVSLKAAIRAKPLHKRRLVTNEQASDRGRSALPALLLSAALVLSTSV